MPSPSSPRPWFGIHVIPCPALSDRLALVSVVRDPTGALRIRDAVLVTNVGPQSGAVASDAPSDQ